MPKDPSTPIKASQHSSPYSSPSRKLAAPNGPWILKSRAMKEYKLAATDLASILPIEDSRNPRGGPNNIQKFNECDVRALASRLTKGVGSSKGTAADDSALAIPKGPKILRTHACKEYNLKGVQLDRIKPISVEANPHKDSAIMRYYNKCDVEKLAKEVRGAAASPSGAAISQAD